MATASPTRIATIQTASSGHTSLRESGRLGRSKLAEVIAAVAHAGSDNGMAGFRRALGRGNLQHLADERLDQVRVVQAAARFFAQDLDRLLGGESLLVVPRRRERVVDVGN